jgi:AcrR family transcriptional regulator
MSPKRRLSTGVDKERLRAPKKSADEHRAHILEVARVLFCASSFDQTGVRDVAAAAKVDPAIVVRVFGSKEALFEAVAEDAFALEEAFEGPTEGMGLRVARLLTGKHDARAEGTFDEFRLLLRSAASPVAGPILSRALHAGFITPLAKRLGGREATVRASLLTACVLGFSTLRVALGAEALESGRGTVTARLGAALQACLDP